MFKNVPESKEGEANKETKGASNVWHQRDNVVGENLMIISQNVLGKDPEEKERLLMAMAWKRGGKPLSEFLALFGQLHFCSIKIVYLFKNVFNFELFH